VKPLHERGAPVWEQRFKVGKTPRWQRADRKVCQALEGGEVVTGSNRFGKASGNARHHPEGSHEEARTAQEPGAGKQPPTMSGVKL
jgi:hypothetical protein